LKSQALIVPPSDNKNNDTPMATGDLPADLNGLSNCTMRCLEINIFDFLFTLAF